MTITELPYGPATVDDWVRLSEADPLHRYELVEGNVHIVVPPSVSHQSASARLMFWLADTGVDRDLIRPETGMLLTPEDLFVPDLLVLAHPVGTGKHLVPDDVRLVVEVVSPSSKKTDRLIKPADYAAAGIEHFWRVENASEDADHGVVEAFTLTPGSGGYVATGRWSLPELLKQPAVPFAGW